MNVTCGISDGKTIFTVEGGRLSKTQTARIVSAIQGILEQPTILDRPVADFHNQLSARPWQTISGVFGIVYIGQLVQMDPRQLENTKNFGRKSLRELKELLESLGLEFGMDVGVWKPPDQR